MMIFTDPALTLNRRRLVQTVNLTIIVLIAFLAILKMILVGTNPPPIPAFILVTGLTANAVYLSRGGSPEKSAVVLVGLLIVGLILGGLNTGGFSGPVVLLSPLIPLSAMLLISNRAAWLSLWAVGLVLAGLYLADVYQLIPENPHSAPLLKFARLLSVASLCLVATGMMWGLARELKEALTKIKGESNTDYLTGIYNRRAIENILSHEVNRTSRDGSWLSFVIGDIDDFKLYNDTNGHQAGDRCLIQTAKTIRARCRRAADVVGRFGGEEFVIILPGTNPNGARKVVEDCRQSIQALNIPYGPDNPNPVTITMGCVSIAGSQIESLDQIIKLADDALYQGKHQGRNCAVYSVLEEEVVSPEATAH